MYLEDNRQVVLQRICQAEISAHRVSGSVQLLAVSKTFPAAAIRELYQYGQRNFGENYVQEWYKKVEQLNDCKDIIWHVIGKVQSNKSRLVAQHAHWLHTLDSLKLAQRLSTQRPTHLDDLNVLIEINITGESSRHGITPNELWSLAQAVMALPRLRLRGLMCVASATEDETVLDNQFSQMSDLLKQLCTYVPYADTLSMGMSADMAVAIAHGATIVRIGSAIFGTRPAIQAA